MEKSRDDDDDFLVSCSQTPRQQQEMFGKVINESSCFHKFTCFMNLSLSSFASRYDLCCAKLLSFFSFIDKHKSFREMENQRKLKQQTGK
jgi:hypothetical protein